MKLRGSIASPYVARVVMCARAKGIALDPEAQPGGGIASVADLLPGSPGGMPVLDIGNVHGMNPAARGAGQQHSVHALQAGLEQLDRFLGAGPYAVGSALTLPRLRDWWQQMGEDPLCVQVLEKEQVPA